MNETDIASTPPGAGLSQDKMVGIFTAFLEEQKAVDPVVIKIADANAFADVLIVAGATSRRHAQGLADGIARLCHEHGQYFSGMEGFDLAEWILLDCNGIVVNIFQEETRRLYRIEELWGRNIQAIKKEI